MAGTLLTTAIAAGARFGNYILQELIGSGAFAQVWKAVHHEQEHREVAIKIVIDSEFRRQLAREARLPPLKHERIVPIIDSDTRFAEIPYVVMPHYRGGTLKELIEKNPNGLTEERVEQVLGDILGALAEAHDKGIIHRDLKPSNILLDEAGHAHISDFGLARNLSATDREKSMVQSGSLSVDAANRVAGTFAYMAPEVMDGRPASAASDVYGLGIILFEMLTGRRPVGFDVPSATRHDLRRRDWDRLFKGSYCSEKGRFTSVAEMGEILLGATGPRDPTASGTIPKANPALHSSVEIANSHASAAPPNTISIPRAPEIKMISRDLDKCVECRGLLSPEAVHCLHCGTHYPRGVSCVICQKLLKWSKAVASFRNGENLWMHSTCRDLVLRVDYSCPACSKHSTVLNYSTYYLCLRCGHPFDVGYCRYCNLTLLKASSICKDGHYSHPLCEKSRSPVATDAAQGDTKADKRTGLVFAFAVLLLVAIGFAIAVLFSNSKSPGTLSANSKSTDTSSVQVGSISPSSSVANSTAAESHSLSAPAYLAKVSDGRGQRPGAEKNEDELRRLVISDIENWRGAWKSQDTNSDRVETVTRFLKSVSNERIAYWSRAAELDNPRRAFFGWTVLVVWNWCCSRLCRCCRSPQTRGQLEKPRCDVHSRCDACERCVQSGNQSIRRGVMVAKSGRPRTYGGNVFAC